MPCLGKARPRMARAVRRPRDAESPGHKAGRPAQRGSSRPHAHACPSPSGATRMGPGIDLFAMALPDHQAGLLRACRAVRRPMPGASVLETARHVLALPSVLEAPSIRRRRVLRVRIRVPSTTCPVQPAPPARVCRRAVQRRHTCVRRSPHLRRSAPQPPPTPQSADESEAVRIHARASGSLRQRGIP